MNRDQRSHVIELLQRHFYTLRGLRVTVFGLAFKPGTDDMRDSPALDLVQRLVADGCFVSADDPGIPNLPEHPEVKVFGDPYSAVRGVEAVIIATEWPLYGQLDLPRLSKSGAWGAFARRPQYCRPSDGLGRGVPLSGHRTRAPVTRRPTTGEVAGRALRTSVSPLSRTYVAGVLRF